jgi:hypothetical protein
MSSTTSKALALAAVCAASAGCGKDNCGDDLDFTNADNYTYSGTVDIPVIVTAAGVNIEVCFDGLTNDMQCHKTDPATDIVNVGLTRVPDLTPEEINDKIANDTLLAKDTTGYVDVATEGATCVNTEDMSFLGTPLDVPKEYYDGAIYLLFVSETREPGVGNRMVVMLQPRDKSDVKHVDVPNGCGILDFTADLTSGESKAVCPGSKTKVDWSAVDTNGLGSPFTPSAVDQLVLAHYNDLTAAELEKSFFDLRLLADEEWTLDLAGDDKADLKDATNASGDNFDDFESSGVYLFALNLTSNPNPAPKFLTVLTPEEE